MYLLSIKVYSNLENDGESILFICKKLGWFGLLQNHMKKMNDDNLKAIVKYLEQIKQRIWMI